MSIFYVDYAQLCLDGWLIGESKVGRGTSSVKIVNYNCNNMKYNNNNKTQR